MTFYLLVFVVALTSIFGIVHSQTAREKLHLQTIYDWSMEALKQQLRKYEIFEAPEGSLRHDAIDEIVEIIVDQFEAPANNSGAASSTESIEEIQGVQLRRQQDDGQEVRPSSQSAAGEEGVEDRDKVLAAINASLRRLSKAAVSGRLNGAQLYDILLQETKLHERAAETVRANREEVGSSGQTESARENAASASADGPRMYFGERPLEYVPHQSG